jgi:MYXO-CTERM domain-containing protein
MRRAFLVLTVACGVGVFASPLVGVDGEATGGLAINSGQALAVAWTQTQDYSIVTVRANISEELFDYSGFMAYLDTSIGPGTTIHNEVASVYFGVGTFGTGWLTLFEDLTLPASFYYLTLAPVSGDTQATWNTTDNPTLTETPGALLGDGLGRQWWASEVDPSYAPASAFALSDPATDGHLLFDVSVPEPATAMLGLAGALALVLLRRRRAA